MLLQTKTRLWIGYIFCFSTSTLAQLPATLPTEAEVLATWRDLGDRVRQSSITISMWQGPPSAAHYDRDTATPQGSRLWKSRPGCFATIYYAGAIDANVAGQVWARNSDYYFELTRSNASPRWTLADLEPRAPSPIPSAGRLSALVPQIEAGSAFLPWSEVLGEDIFERIMAGKIPIRVDAARSAEDAGKLAIWAELQDEIMSNGTLHNVTRLISIITDDAFLPERITDDYGGYMQREFTFSDWESIAGLRLPTKCVLEVLPRRPYVRYYAVDVASGRTPAEAEFRLPAFGISEPDFVRRSQPWALYGGAIVVLFAIVYWVYRRSNQRSVS